MEARSSFGSVFLYYPAFWNGDVQSVPLYIRSTLTISLSYKGLELHLFLKFQKSLWSLVLWMISGLLNTVEFLGSNKIYFVLWGENEILEPKSEIFWFKIISLNIKLTGGRVERVNFHYNLTGFRSIMEILLCDYEGISRKLDWEKEELLGMWASSPHGLNNVETVSWVPASVSLLPDCGCNVTSCRTILLPYLPCHYQDELYPPLVIPVSLSLLKPFLPGISSQNGEKWPTICE